MQLTIRTVEYPLREAHPLVRSQSMPTTTTCLAGVRRIDGYEGSTGAFCLVREHRPKSPPRSVRDRLGQTVIVHHPIDFQILYSYQPEPIDYPAGMLVTEVIPTPPDSLVNPRNYFPSFGSLWRAFLLAGQKTAGLSQRVFLRTEEARVLNLLS